MTGGESVRGHGWAGSSVPKGATGHLLHRRTQEGPCVTCGRVDLQSVDMELANGDHAQMQSCSRCEVRTWWHNGAQLGLDDVLVLVRQAGVRQAPRGKRKR